METKGKKSKKEGITKTVHRLLRDAGYSQDSHIHLLNEDFLHSRSSMKSVQAIMALRRYLRSLDPLSRKLCVMEFLEPDRYYRFWYYQFLNEDDFRTLRRKIGRETEKLLEMVA